MACKEVQVKTIADRILQGFIESDTGNFKNLAVVEWKASEIDW